MPVPPELKKAASHIRRITQHPRFYDTLTILSICIYAITFSYHLAQKHYAFSTYAWDLGIFSQALYNTIFEGKPLYYTAELFLNPTGNYFAIHFSPILLLLTPFYALYPDALTLLILKSIILPLAAMPLYIIATKVFNDRKTGYLIAVTYLLNPALHGANWFDFQPQAFIPLLMFILYFLMIRRGWIPYLIFSMLFLMVIEPSSILLTLFSLGFLIRNPKLIIKKLKKRELNEFSVAIITIILSITYFIIARRVISSFPINQEFITLYKATKNFEVLGINGDPMLIPLYVLFHPDKAFQALLYDYHLKFLYIIFLFAPLLFIPLKNRMSWLALAFMFPLLLSNWRAYYMVGSHYALYVLPFIFIGLIEALRHEMKELLTPHRILVKAVAISLIFTISLSPISPLSHTFIKQNLLWYPAPYSIDEKVRSAHEMIRLVPRNSSILTQNHIFPHFSNRVNAYVIPILEPHYLKKSSIKKYLISIIEKSEFILLDLRTRDPWVTFVLNYILSNRTHAPYAVTGPFVLFEKDYSGEAIFIPHRTYQTFHAYRDLTLSGPAKIVRDTTSKSTYVVYCPAGSGTFLFGPYAYIPKGVYDVMFRVKVESYNESATAFLDVACRWGLKVLAYRRVYGFELEPGRWQNVTLRVWLCEDQTDMEFRVFSTNATSLYVDQVVVQRVSPTSDVDFGTQTFTGQNLVLEIANTTKNGFIFFDGGGSGWGFLWYGPYITLPKGRYRVHFYLKAIPLHPNLTRDYVLTLDVAKDYARSILAQRVVNYTDVQGLGWHRVTLEFTLNSTAHHVEFRGLKPSPNFKILLAFILLERV